MPKALPVRVSETIQMDFLEENCELLCLERDIWAEGFSFVAGVDEVGRGPLAGPVVACAVILPRGTRIPAVGDSKALSERRRRELDAQLRELPGIDFAIAEVDVETIDRINILQATTLAMQHAVEKLVKCDYILVDGRPVKNLVLPSKAVVKGDAKSASIAAASILAKVYRDKLMDELHNLYPEYNLKENKGYGTQEHLLALREYGISPLHRKSFSPVKEMLQDFEQPDLI